MRLTINLDYDKNGPLRGPQTTGSAIPRLKSGACTEEFRSPRVHTERQRIQLISYDART